MGGVAWKKGRVKKEEKERRQLDAERGTAAT